MPKIKAAHMCTHEGQHGDPLDSKVRHVFDYFRQ